MDEKIRISNEIVNNWITAVEIFGGVRRESFIEMMMLDVPGLTREKAENAFSQLIFHKRIHQSEFVGEKIVKTASFDKCSFDRIDAFEVLVALKEELREKNLSTKCYLNQAKFPFDMLISTENKDYFVQICDSQAFRKLTLGNMVKKDADSAITLLIVPFNKEIGFNITDIDFENRFRIAGIVKNNDKYTCKLSDIFDGR